MVDEKKEQPQVRSFRVTDEVTEKIKQIQSDLKLTQDAALRRMIQAYEMEQAKEVIPERETEISNFQVKAQELVEAFLYSLQLNQDAEARIRQEFEAELVRNQKTIDNYQSQIEALKAEKALLSEDASRVKTLQAELDAVTEQARRERNDSADRLAEKDRLISSLDGEVVKYKAQAEGYEALKADRDSLASQLRDANEKISTMTKEHEVDLEREGRKADQAKVEAVATAKAEAQVQIDALKDKIAETRVAGEKAVQEALKVAAEDLRKAVHEVEETAHAADKAAAEEIWKLKMEVQQLREQLKQKEKEQGA